MNALLAGTVDVAITTPTVTAAMAFQGQGPYAQAHSNLRTISALPHRDRLLFAIDAEIADRYGLYTLADFVAKQPPLRIATGFNDSINVIGYAVDKVLNVYGTTWEALEQWGGQYCVADTPMPPLAWFAAGEVDALFHEAMMIWPSFLNGKAVRYLSLDSTELEALHQRYGYMRADLEPGDLPGVERNIPTVDFSQWMIIARDDLPEEVAYLLTQVIVEDRADFEARYSHLPVQASPLHYPMKPEVMCQVDPIPLHPGAMRYYREHGFLK
jgi:TRAP-type uncharacterized transport system substrate-binding protein